ncbi:MAG: hypothetical protein KC964_16600 [Candidatus Omnitrophica bacterium]|nr:hypothetical protein [Candidatus Omnitrophota bacterium]
MDLVCNLEISREDESQKELKAKVGREVRAYATSYGIHNDPEEKHRCWRLEYADQVRFHMDILPAIPEEEFFIQWLVQEGVEESQAKEAIAITDDRHPRFDEIQNDWPRSNPKGFASWFEERMRRVARARLESLVRRGIYASVDEVPPYTWRTPLQQAIQILKRHRDVMFRSAQGEKPISMILTTLAAMSYEGEEDLFETVFMILERMPSWVEEKFPKVKNPVNPAEDFADKWRSNPRLEDRFWEWHTQAKADIKNLRNLSTEAQLSDWYSRKFSVRPRRETVEQVLECRESLGGIGVGAPTVIIGRSAPKPWRSDG